jgi:hypothetical protein
LTSNDYARLAGIVFRMAAEVDPGNDKNADFYHGRKVAYHFLKEGSKALYNLAEKIAALESERQSARPRPHPQRESSPAVNSASYLAVCPRCLERDGGVPGPEPEPKPIQRETRGRKEHAQSAGGAE